MSNDTGDAVQTMGVVVLSISTGAILLSALYRYRTLALRAARRRAIQAAAAERTQLQRPQHPPGEPLPPAVLNVLPKAYVSDSNALLQDMSCSICLMEYEGMDEILTLPCKHVFHSSCISLWFQSHSNCPICRLSVSSPLPADVEAANPLVADWSPQIEASPGEAGLPRDVVSSSTSAPASSEGGMALHAQSMSQEAATTAAAGTVPSSTALAVSLDVDSSSSSVPDVPPIGKDTTSAFDSASEAELLSCGTSATNSDQESPSKRESNKRR